ncbi:hypothetical protein [Sphingobium boeckii]|uniref:Secreted protein n=1 Tax=Sphingobium boeckii TaxID=1082345 RepID=A0A7W9EDP1_9SPHN|nr:hypothetical protein [Sphingobium boeckii]MBB5685488.1 hypothetical protein [Sphingobium boeckii]
MKRIILGMALIVGGLSGAAMAAEGEIPQRTRVMTTYGDERCPQSTDPDEIVVCAHEPETERFRVPKRFRGQRPDDAPAAQAWGARVESMDQITRFTRPNSCSAVGSSGQTGCTALMLQQWFADRRAMKSEEEAWRAGSE